MFELIFHYHKKLENGKYDSDDCTMKKTLGKKDEEVPLEKVASFIISNLARRDIWITDVELFEFAKRQITFRESKDGIVLKNRKFSFGRSGVVDEGLIAEEDKEVVQPQIKATVPSKPSAPSKSKFIREEFFMADIDGPSPFKNLTPKKKYGVIRETETGRYVVMNDNNMEMLVDSCYFTCVGAGVVYDGPISQDPNLQSMEEALRSKIQGQNNIQYGGEIIPESQMSMTPMARR
jgi:hypothetical protein